MYSLDQSFVFNIKDGFILNYEINKEYKFEYTSIRIILNEIKDNPMDINLGDMIIDSNKNNSIIVKEGKRTDLCFLL